MNQAMELAVHPLHGSLSTCGVWQEIFLQKPRFFRVFVPPHQRREDYNSTPSGKSQLLFSLFFIFFCFSRLIGIFDASDAFYCDSQFQNENPEKPKKQSMENPEFTVSGLPCSQFDYRWFSSIILYSLFNILFYLFTGIPERKYRLWYPSAGMYRR